MFQVKISFYESSPSGGVGKWSSEIKLFDATTAIELETKINTYLKGEKSDYKKNLSVESINRF